MRPDFTNLLPEERARANARSYWLRLAALTAYLALAIVVVNALFLAPTYILAQGEISARTAELATLEAAQSASGGSSYAANLVLFNRQASALAALGAARYGAPLLASILAIPHPGVSLTGFSISAGGQVAIQGIATTRDALRAYDLALSGAPFAASVALPVSAYAAERDLTFAMTLTLVSP